MCQLVCTRLRHLAARSPGCTNLQDESLWLSTLDKHVLELRHKVFCMTSPKQFNLTRLFIPAHRKQTDICLQKLSLQVQLGIRAMTEKVKSLAMAWTTGVRLLLLEAIFLLATTSRSYPEVKRRKREADHSPPYSTPIRLYGSVLMYQGNVTCLAY
jgi:hypothetical protein